MRRLFEVAAAKQCEQALRAGLRRMRIAAVGPVVAEELRRQGIEASIIPDRAYFMKPLVSATVTALSD